MYFTKDKTHRLLDIIIHCNLTFGEERRKHYILGVVLSQYNIYWNLMGLEHLNTPQIGISRVFVR